MADAVTTSRRTLRDLQRAATEQPVAMLTCYDATYAALLAEARIDFVLVGDSAANVVLGHHTTRPIHQERLNEMANAIRRAHPAAFILLDIAFGADEAAILEAVKHTDADALKLEAAAAHVPLLRRLNDAGVAVFAHLGLTPQTVMRDGGYRYRGRNPAEIDQLLREATACVEAGAVALLLEATTPAATEAVRQAVDVPIIGCGAGPGCAGYVVVLHDLLQLTPKQPKFVPTFAIEGSSLRAATLSVMRQWKQAVEQGHYPDARHCYGEAT